MWDGIVADSIEGTISTHAVAPLSKCPGEAALSPESGGTARLSCDYPSCKSKKTYRGRWELNRHRLSHDQASHLHCPVIGCSRTGRKPFSRVDKLRAHMRGHGETALVRCPNDGCNISPLPFNLMNVHLMSRRYSLSHLDKVLPGQLNYRGDLFRFWHDLSNGRICPLSPCYKQLQDTTALREHLRTSHHERDRISQRSVVVEAGINPISCHFICPVCKEDFADDKEFKAHVFGHLVNVEHLISFANQINPHVAAAEYPYLDPYGKIFGENWVNSLRCETCPFSSPGGWSLKWRVLLNGHSGLMLADEKVVQFRAELLRILPTMGFHSVFDDL
jgi:hypothetical protein